MTFYSIPSWVSCGTCGLAMQAKVTKLPFGEAHCQNSLCDDYMKKYAIEFPETKIVGPI